MVCVYTEKGKCDVINDTIDLEKREYEGILVSE